MPEVARRLYALSDGWSPSNSLNRTLLVTWIHSPRVLYILSLSWCTYQSYGFKYYLGADHFQMLLSNANISLNPRVSYPIVYLMCPFLYRIGTQNLLCTRLNSWYSQLTTLVLVQSSPLQSMANPSFFSCSSYSLWRQCWRSHNVILLLLFISKCLIFKKIVSGRS